MRVGRSGSPVISILTAPSSTMTTTRICEGSAIDAKRLSTCTLSKRLVTRSRAATSSRAAGSTRMPPSTPASLRISSSGVAVLPWIWIAETPSICRLRRSAVASAKAERPALQQRAMTADHMSADRDLGRDVGPPVIVILERVAQVQRPDGERGANGHLEIARQPHVGKRLAHRHRRAEIVDVHEPLHRQEIEPDVVEGVFHDLVGLRLDPERHQRDFVHHAHERRVVRSIAVGRASSVPAAIRPAEQLRRVVLDAQHLAAVDRLAADERVLAFLELEPEKVRGRNELWLTRLFQQSVDVHSVALRISIVIERDDHAVVREADFVRRRGRLARRGSRAPLLALLLSLQIIGFERTALAVAELYAVDLQRAADEEAVADVPGVFAPLAPDRDASRPPDVQRFPLVEDVLLQLLPVLVAFGQHLFHEGVEIGLGPDIDSTRRPHARTPQCHHEDTKARRRKLFSGPHKTEDTAQTDGRSKTNASSMSARAFSSDAITFSRSLTDSIPRYAPPASTTSRW